MQNEKHLAALKEVFTAIDEALKAEGGLLSHQRRLMAMLSLGTQHIVELYFHRKLVLKPGTQVKHEWFKLSEERLKERLAPSLTKPWAEIGLMNEIYALANKLEIDRNDIIYGAPLANDSVLRAKIGRFLDLRKLIEEETGEL